MLQKNYSEALPCFTSAAAASRGIAFLANSASPRMLGRYDEVVGVYLQIFLHGSPSQPRGSLRGAQGQRAPLQEFATRVSGCSVRSRAPVISCRDPGLLEPAEL